MKYIYQKLVRDNIPEQINSKPGKKCQYYVLDNEEYLKELNKKVLEEANEFIEENSVEELADLTEVLEAIMKAKKITKEELEKAKQIKKEKKGAFEKQYFLEWVEE